MSATTQGCQRRGDPGKALVLKQSGEDVSVRVGLRFESLGCLSGSAEDRVLRCVSFSDGFSLADRNPESIHCRRK